MAPKIDIFNGIGNTEYYEALREAIAHLSRFKPGTEVRNFKNANKFLNFLIPKSLDNHGRIDLKKLLDVSFNYSPFRENSQKIILLDQPTYYNGHIYRGLTGGYGPDENGRGFYRAAIALSTRGTNPDQFYALSCHELGHIYGATKRRHKLKDDNIHCSINLCAMNYPAYHKHTSRFRREKKDMFCPDCQEGLKKYKV